MPRALQRLVADEMNEGLSHGSQKACCGEWHCACAQIEAHPRQTIGCARKNISFPVSLMHG